MLSDQPDAEESGQYFVPCSLYCTLYYTLCTLYSYALYALCTLYTCPTTTVDQASLQEMVYKLFHLVLVYAFQEEVDGWRLWVDTAASLHAYVSKVPLLWQLLDPCFRYHHLLSSIRLQSHCSAEFTLSHAGSEEAYHRYYLCRVKTVKKV